MPWSPAREARKLAVCALAPNLLYDYRDVIEKHEHPEESSEEPAAGGLSDIAHDILEYLSDNPGARDTLDGIAEWWLLDRQIRRELENVQGAVDQLLDADFLEECRGGDQRLHYRLNARRVEEIGALIRRRRRHG